MSSPYVYNYDGEKSFTLSKWKTKVGSQLFYNSVILSYKSDGVSNGDAKEPVLKYKSNFGGTVVELLACEGETVKPGAQLLKVQPCTHPVIMKDLCAECGQDLRSLDRDNFEKLTAATTFSMVHVVPELKVCLEQAEKLGRDDENRLLKSRKLVLLVDLDQTLIHTTNDNVLQNLPDVHHFQLYGPNSPWYHTKLRPGTSTFLENISKFYELHICTFGARLYAHKIAKLLDPDGKLFSHRILSRDECFDATSKTGNLKALFPRGDDMVCIIDDREDVWNFAPNVVHVKPYCYFHNTGDINAPPFSAPVLNRKQAPNMPVIADSNISESKASNKDATQGETSVYIDDNIVKDKVDDNVSLQKSDAVNIPPQKTNAENVPLQKSDADNVLPQKSDADDLISQKSDADDLISQKSDADNVPAQKNDADNVTPQKSDKPMTDTGGNNSNVKNSASVGKPCESESKKPEGNEGQADKTLENNPSLTNEMGPPDDYLLYLEEILVNIHKEYYKRYDKMKSAGKKSIPDLKVVVPEVRRKVLKGCNIVFSSVIPTNLLPETSHFWTLAESLGAKVSVDLVLDSSRNRTTHVVASKLGTAKVNTAKRHPNINIVGLDWLFCCAERWEHADERLFPLRKDTMPLFIDGNKPFDGNLENSFYDPTTGKSLKGWPGSKRPHRVVKKKSRKSRSKEEDFSERIFVEAGLSLSQEDIEDMDREIEEACSEESEKESQGNSSSESSSEESLSSGDYPKGWKRRRKAVPDIEVNDANGESSDADTIGSVDEEIAEAVKQEFGS